MYPNAPVLATVATSLLRITEGAKARFDWAHLSPRKFEIAKAIESGSVVFGRPAIDQRDREFCQDVFGVGVNQQTIIENDYNARRDCSEFRSVGVDAIMPSAWAQHAQDQEITCYAGAPWTNEPFWCGENVHRAADTFTLRQR